MAGLLWAKSISGPVAPCRQVKMALSRWMVFRAPVTIPLFYQGQGAGGREFRVPAEVSLPIECTDQGQVAGWSAYAGLEGCTVGDEFGDVSCHGLAISGGSVQPMREAKARTCLVERTAN